MAGYSTADVMDRYQFFTIEEITTPKSGEVIRDAFWLVDKNGQVGFYSFSGHFTPQCNTDRKVAEVVKSSTSKIGPGSWATSIVQLPLAFLPDPPERVKRIHRRLDNEV